MNDKRKFFFIAFILLTLFLLHNFLNAKWQETDRFKTLLLDGYRPVQFSESRLAHKLLDGLKGIEIGASAHNPYAEKNPFQVQQMAATSRMAKVHIVAAGDNLPFTNDSMDFVLSSHVLEHFFDPIKAIQEWLRVVKSGGFVYMDIPHKERTSDKERNRTTLAELLDRQKHPQPDAYYTGHHSIWITEDLLELCRHFNWTVAEWCDQDDKTAINEKPAMGFTIVLKK